MKILLADDDLDVLDITAYALRRQGFAVTLATDGSQALQAWQDTEPDVVLLDIRMPKVSGFEVLRAIRLRDETPVIMVSARSEEEDILRGLDLGADDYVTKPFSPTQLGARIRTVARRGRRDLPKPSDEVEAAGIVLHLETHEATRGSLVVRMTPLEHRILRALMLDAGRLVPSDRLIERAWGFDGGDTNMLKTHISQIRKRLMLRAGEPGYIKNVMSIGYTLEK